MPAKPAQSSAKNRPVRSAPLLPHERDQAKDAVTPHANPIVEQAKHDIDAGLVDTDMRATPGLDAQRRQELVQGPAATTPAERAARSAGPDPLEPKARRRKAP
ncbi:MAG: hypothetical protein JNM33_06275 [Rubrivivax sp.]|nr:hypothetical protein [Rubrivivax sp.]